MNPLHARMEPDELHLTMVKLECRSNVALGQKIGVAPSTIGTWRRGLVGVPRHIAMLLRMLVSPAN